jgi:hypothetical protein
MMTSSPEHGPGEDDPCSEWEAAITTALAGLDDIRDLPVSEHVERFEAVHTALTEALGSAESLLSGPNGHGS